MARRLVSINLRNALLRGEAIRPTEYAKKLGVSRQSVMKAMSQFGPCVAASERGIWRVVDTATLQHWQPPMMSGTRNHLEKLARLGELDQTQRRFDALLQAWGLPLKPIPIQSEIWCRREMKSDMLEFA